MMKRVAGRLSARELANALRTWKESLMAHRSSLRSKEWGLKLLSAYLVKNKESAVQFGFLKWQKLWRKAANEERRKREGIEFFGKVASKSKSIVIRRYFARWKVRSRVYG